MSYLTVLLKVFLQPSLSTTFWKRVGSFFEAHEIPTTFKPLSFKSCVFGLRNLMSLGNLQRKVRFVAAALHSSFTFTKNFEVPAI